MIELHPIAVVKSQSLINIGAFLRLFPISLFRRVAMVSDNLEKNKLFASDVQDLICLANILIQHSQPSDLLKQDMSDLVIYLTMKINQFSSLPKACAKFTQKLGI